MDEHEYESNFISKIDNPIYNDQNIDQEIGVDFGESLAHVKLGLNDLDNKSGIIGFSFLLKSMLSNQKYKFI